MKKIFSIALAVAFAFSAVSAVSAQSMTNAFNTNLTLGSRGADVVSLQSFLESKGLLTMPAGVAKGYFGGLTKSAVVAYQISKGVTPASGYFGPLTRATANADTTTTTTTTTPGCPAGALFNSMTGASCATTTTTTTTTTTGTVTTSGVEGTLDTKLAASPANNANVQTQNDVPVYGIEFKARVADSVVQTVDLQVSVDNNGSSENPATLINTIKVWDGSNVIATIPVNSSTFTKDSNQVYYVRISGLNFAVAKDTTKVLTFSVSSNSIDTTRTVTIDGYGASSVRAVSGNGISSFYSIDGSAYTRTHTFKKPGTSTLTLSAATSPLRSQNYRINPDNGAQYVPVLNFNLKSETGDSNLQTIVVTLATSTKVSTIYLYDGSTLIDSKNAAGTVTFDNLDGKINVSNGTTKTLTIKADFPSDATSGGSLTATVSTVNYQKPNGTSATLSTSVAGVAHYVFNNAAQWSLAGTPTITKVSNQNGSTTEMSATFTFNVTALGSTVRKPVAADFWIDATTGSVSASSSVGAPVVIPNNDIADGSTAQVSVTATVNSAAIASSGSYAFVISRLSWASTTGSNVNQTWGLDDFKTPSTSYFNK